MFDNIRRYAFVGQTKPIGEQVEVELRFCGEAISKELVEKALQLFCDVVQGATAAVEMPLSSFLEASGFKNAQNATSSSSIVVQVAWKQVFGSEAKVKDIPFNTFWGDLLGAAALSKIYRKEGSL